MTSDLGPEHVPVLLVPGEGEDWLEIREWKDDDFALRPVTGPLVEAARAALSLRDGQRVGARTFVCHPDDLALLDGAPRRFVDKFGYARAFAHDVDGHFVVNARYKEVLPTSPVAFDPVSVAILASQMQTQAMLEQMQTQLADIQDALDYLKRTDNLDLKAEILNNARLIDDMWTALQLDGSVPQTDWDEAQHLGSTLTGLHSKVLGRLQILCEELDFSDLDGARAARNVTARDVKNLFHLERYIYRALCQHSDLSLQVRAQRGEDCARPLERARQIQADHLRESEAVGQSFAKISPDAKRELSGIIKTGVYSYIEQGRAIRDGMAHVRAVSRVVPTTLTRERPVMRLSEADSGLRAPTERNTDSDLDY